MAVEAELPVEERIHQLLQHLGIKQAHFAASNPVDWQGLVTAHPEVISSLTLVTPRSIDPSIARTIASRLLVFNGDRGNSAVVALQDYQRSNYADVIADRGESMGTALINFLGRMDEGEKFGAVPMAEGEGEVAGISYKIRGSGPPLLLIPIEYAASQWEPLESRLAQHFSTITLGGAWLGAVGTLEARAKGS